MMTIPMQAQPWQAFNVSLAGQSCRIEIYQRSTGLFVNLSVSDAMVVGGAIAQNRNRIVRSAYLGFTGDILFLDIEDNSDPTYDGLGTRFVLVYLSPAEVTAGLAAGLLG